MASKFPKTLHHPDREDTRVAHNDFDVTRFGFEGYHEKDVVTRIQKGRERLAKQADEARAKRQEQASMLQGEPAPAAASTPKRTTAKRSTAKRTAKASTKAATETPTPEPASDAQVDSSAL